MALKPYYNDGTATLTNGQVAVTFQGAGVNLLTNQIFPGDRIETDIGEMATILTVGPGPLEATVDKVFRGTSQVAKPYKIWRTFDAQYLMEGAREAFELLGSGGIAALAQLVGAADQGIYFTGPGVLAAFALTAAGRALLDDANVPAQRATLGLGSAALKNTGTSGNNVPLLDGANTWSAAQRNTALPICRVTRNNGAETFAVNTEYALLGSFVVSQGGFLTGAVVVSGGNRVKVPATGQYLIVVSIYVQASGSGRLNIIVNGNPSNSLGFGIAALNGEKATAIFTASLNAGDDLSYYCSIANAQVYTASSHTDVAIIYLG